MCQDEAWLCTVIVGSSFTHFSWLYWLHLWRDHRIRWLYCTIRGGLCSARCLPEGCSLSGRICVKIGVNEGFVRWKPHVFSGSKAQYCWFTWRRQRARSVAHWAMEGEGGEATSILYVWQREPKVREYSRWPRLRGLGLIIFLRD